MLIKVFGIWLNPDCIKTLFGTAAGTDLYLISDQKPTLSIAGQKPDEVAVEINKQIKASKE